MRPRDLPQLLKEAASEWIEDGAMRLSSSLAYYAIFSLAPALIIVMSIAGLVFGEEAARGQITHQISALAGARAGEAIQATVQASASEKTTDVLATIIGLVVLLFGASTVFAHSSTRSADFIASDYCYDVEMTRALERHQNREARVIP